MILNKAENRDKLNKYLIDKDLICKKLDLQDVNKVKFARQYLFKRLQNDKEKFAWDFKNMELYIFNMTDDNKVIGLQKRRFKKVSPKYLTYNISRIPVAENFINPLILQLP